MSSSCFIGAVYFIYYKDFLNKSGYACSGYLIIKR